MESSQNKFEIVWTFIKTVATVRKSRDLLLLLNSGHVELTDSQLDNNIEAKRLYDGIPKSGNYDLIYIDSPLGVKSRHNGRAVNLSIKAIIDSLPLLKNDGEILAIVEPSIFIRGNKGLKTLNSEGAYIHAIVNTPPDYLRKV